MDAPAVNLYVMVKEMGRLYEEVNPRNQLEKELSRIDVWQARNEERLSVNRAEIAALKGHRDETEARRLWREFITLCSQKRELKEKREEALKVLQKASELDECMELLQSHFN